MADKDVREIVNTWASRFRGGPLARDTDAYNQVMTALPDLVTALGGDAPAVQAEPVAKPAPAVKSSGAAAV